MRKNRWLVLLMLLLTALVVGACGGDDDDDGGDDSSSTPAQEAPAAGTIEKNADNASTKLVIGSKNFTEQKVLGEIYAQAFSAAGYEVSTELNLGDEKTALKALKGGDISAYPEYTGTALLSFFGKKADELPKNALQAWADVKDAFVAQKITAEPPTPFVSSNEVAVTKETADKLGLKKVSDLEGKSQDLTLYGSPECRQRLDCLVGLQKDYGLKFKKFTPVDIGLRYDVLDKGQADLSILFTTDAQLSTSDKYVLLEDDKKVFPPGNVIFVASKATADKAGPDMRKTIENVQQGLTERVMQELNARVDVDRETPRAVARAYLQESGYLE